LAHSKLYTMLFLYVQRSDVRRLLAWPFRSLLSVIKSQSLPIHLSSFFSQLIYILSYMAYLIPLQCIPKYTKPILAFVFFLWSLIHASSRDTSLSGSIRPVKGRSLIHILLRWSRLEQMSELLGGQDSADCCSSPAA
jgi:hypothetical protein